MANPETRPDQGRITQAEMASMFGSEMPIEAMELLWNAPGSMTLGEVRARLREIANAKG